MFGAQRTRRHKRNDNQMYACDVALQLRPVQYACIRKARLLGNFLGNCTHLAVYTPGRASGQNYCQSMLELSRRWHRFSFSSMVRSSDQRWRNNYFLTASDAKLWHVPQKRHTTSIWPAPDSVRQWSVVSNVTIRDSMMYTRRISSSQAPLPTKQTFEKWITIDTTCWRESNDFPVINGTKNLNANVFRRRFFNLRFSVTMNMRRHCLISQRPFVKYNCKCKRSTGTHHTANAQTAVCVCVCARATDIKWSHRKFIYHLVWRETLHNVTA